MNLALIFKNNAMETRSAKKRRLHNNLINIKSETNITGEDRITHLPDAVLYDIFNRLPAPLIETIVRMSILSKKWRNVWYNFPDLDFTKFVTFPEDSNAKILYLKNLGNAINQILSSRNNNSEVRLLRFYASMSFSALNSVIRNAVRLRVQELDMRVETTYNDAFNFPRSIIRNDCLRVLKIKSLYGFRLLPDKIISSGFKNLETLSFSDVHLGIYSSLTDMFTDSTFPKLRKLYLAQCCDMVHLRVACPLLEELVMENCRWLQGLEILSPKLETLRVSNCFRAIDYMDKCWLKIDTPTLRSFVWVNTAIPGKSCWSNLDCLADVTLGLLVSRETLGADRLESASSFLTALSNAVSLTLEQSLVELNSLEVHPSRFSCLANVLKVCPMVHTLTIKINNLNNPPRKFNRPLVQALSYFEQENYWESQIEGLSPLLKYLKFVTIQGVTEYHGMSLAKFTLKYGTVLQDFIIYPGEEDWNTQHERIKSSIMKFSRASIDAKITFHESLLDPKEPAFSEDQLFICGRHMHLRESKTDHMTVAEEQGRKFLGLWFQFTTFHTYAH
ncbi:putative F-box/FBD/LRR-repeat protein At4g03220 [Rutidosis leptorrhynchoides]|uniref:putative F-box/FBD/LRR-repeat protein At4g03220 n=1 Tax=Rutidosis leptorrhynchoides TaxID=125765 RepID=UPI003A99D6C2